MASNGNTGRTAAEARAASYWQRVREVGARQARAGREQAQASGLEAAAAEKREEAREDRAAARTRSRKL